MLNNQTIYRKVKNLYNNTKKGNITILMAIRRIKAILLNSDNEDVQPYIVNWENFVDIHPKAYYLRKLIREYPTIEQDEAKFEHKELGLDEATAKSNGKHAKIEMHKDIRDLHMMSSNWIQYNANIGRYEAAQSSGLKILLYDLNPNNKKKPKSKKRSDKDE